jgi:hypothetical protein
VVTTSLPLYHLRTTEAAEAAVEVQGEAELPAQVVRLSGQCVTKIADLEEVDNKREPAPEKLIQPGETAAGVFENVRSHTCISY